MAVSRKLNCLGILGVCRNKFCTGMVLYCFHVPGLGVILLFYLNRGQKSLYLIEKDILSRSGYFFCHPDDEELMILCHQQGKLLFNCIASFLPLEAWLAFSPG